MSINKNISVWRGDINPPTDYHLWEKSDGSLWTHIDKTWLQLTSPEDKNTLDQLYRIVYNQNSSVTLSGSPSIIEKGVSTSINLNWAYIFNDERAVPEVMQLKTGNTLLVDDPKTTNFKYSISDSTEFSAVAVNKGVAKYKILKINAYYPMYFGTGGEEFDESLITEKNKRPIASSPAGSYEMQFPEKSYGWFCIPSGMSIKKVTSNEFEVPLADVVYKQINGEYLCYRTYYDINPGKVKFLIS